MMRKFLFIFASLVLVMSQNVLAKTPNKTITPSQAIHAIGQEATVCGIAASVHFAARSRGKPTFINLGQPYPNQVFTIVIWGDDRYQFDPSPEQWQGKSICVSGLVKLYRGTPEIVAYDPDQIQPPH